MYTKDDFYIDNGYVVILGSKTYKLSDVKDIFLRGESMFLDFTDNTRDYERISVTRENIAVLVEFLNEFKEAKQKELMDLVDTIHGVEVEEESTENTSDTLLFVVLIISLLLNVYLLLF